MPASLTGFLGSRFADDEAVARHYLDMLPEGRELGIGPMEPARVLADCAMRRELLELHAPSKLYGQTTCQICADGSYEERHEWPCPTIVALTIPYHQHPDFNSDWIRTRQ